MSLLHCHQEKFKSLYLYATRLYVFAQTCKEYQGVVRQELGYTEHITLSGNYLVKQISI